MRVHDDKPLDQDGLPFKVRVKNHKEPLRSHLPKLPDKKTSSHKLSDLPNDIQQLQARLQHPFMLLNPGYLLQHWLGLFFALLYLNTIFFLDHILNDHLKLSSHFFTCLFHHVEVL